MNEKDRLVRGVPETERTLDLIYQEFLLRVQLGESPDPADYLRRFPQYAADLKKQFELFDALSDNSNAMDNLDSSEGLGGAPESMAAQSIDGYRILGIIGQGSTGTVYEAEQVAVGRKVALKIMPQGISPQSPRLKRFLLEA
ncbi:MAG: hypothetical protein KDA92_23160, partial [Planctomycetales bacterium]|nr:hypothetical protein [Planctomycetales bacterium]